MIDDRDKLREALGRLDKQRASSSEPGAVDFATVVEDESLDLICAAARLVLDVGIAEGEVEAALAAFFGRGADGLIGGGGDLEEDSKDMHAALVAAALWRVQSAPLKLREEIALCIKETTVCGLSLPSREWVFCDDPRLGDAKDGYGNPIRDDTCECKTMADAIVSGPIAELVWERDALRVANAKIPEALSDAFRAGAEAMQEKLKQFCEGNISVRGVHGARQAPYWRGCLEAITDADLPTLVDD